MNRELGIENELQATRAGWTTFGTLSADDVVPLVRKVKVGFNLDGFRVDLGALSVKVFGGRDGLSSVLNVSFIGASGRQSAERSVTVPFSAQQIKDAEWGDTGAVGPGGTDFRMSLVGRVDIYGGIIVSIRYFNDEETLFLDVAACEGTIELVPRG